MSLIETIPPERLALLDSATLYHGAHHDERGGPDCRHCARELLHEVVTGKHADKSPPGVTAFAAVLPRLNDAFEWRDDAHRTAVLRPYLKRFLALDPAHDQERIYALVDYAYRKVLPDLCDALKLPDEAAKLRALAPVVDAESAAAALDLDLALALDLALDLALARDRDLDFARDLARDLALALDLALDLALARDRDLDFARALATDDQEKAWETAVRDVLDLICGID